jgi:hypothetical protein
VLKAEGGGRDEVEGRLKGKRFFNIQWDVNRVLKGKIFKEIFLKRASTGGKSTH